MEKSAGAFRTISEVADFLETPAHVLRFWESRFPQIKPIKRAGGRRYYRPADVALLSGIKRLLHDEGMTIRGVQKILREQGVRHVSGLTETEAEAAEALEAAFAQEVVPEKPEAEVVSLSEWVGAVDAPEGPATKTVEPVTTDDEIVEEDAFRSALDWAKSLETTTEAPDERPRSDAILHLTELVTVETEVLVDVASSDETGLSEDPVSESDEDFVAFDEGKFADAEDVAENALRPDSAAEQPSFDPFTKIVNQARHPTKTETDSAPPPVATAADSPLVQSADDDDARESVWLPTQLRNRTAADFAAHTSALRPLHARLTALHARMAEALRSSRT